MRLALGGAVAMGCAMGIGRFVYTPVLPFMAEAIPLTASEGRGDRLGQLPGLSARRHGDLAAAARPAENLAARRPRCERSDNRRRRTWPSEIAIALFRFLGGAASALSPLVFASSQVLEGLGEPAGRRSPGCISPGSEFSSRFRPR